MPRGEDELADYLSRIVVPLVAPAFFNIRPFSLYKLLYYIIFYSYIILYYIVSFANFSSFTLSIYLAKMLSPVVGNTGNTVNMNSCEFAHFGEDKTLGALDIGIARRRFSLHQNCGVIHGQLAIKFAETRLKARTLS